MADQADPGMLKGGVRPSASGHGGSGVRAGRRSRPGPAQSQAIAHVPGDLDQGGLVVGLAASSGDRRRWRREILGQSPGQSRDAARPSRAAARSAAASRKRSATASPAMSPGQGDAQRAPRRHRHPASAPAPSRSCRRASVERPAGQRVAPDDDGTAALPGCRAAAAASRSQAARQSARGARRPPGQEQDRRQLRHARPAPGQAGVHRFLRPFCKAWAATSAARQPYRAYQPPPDRRPADRAPGIRPASQDLPDGRSLRHKAFMPGRMGGATGADAAPPHRLGRSRPAPRSACWRWRRRITRPAAPPRRQLYRRILARSPATCRR